MLQKLFEQLGGRVTSRNVLNFDESPFSQRAVSKGKKSVVVSDHIPHSRVQTIAADAFAGHVTVAVTVAADGAAFGRLLIIDGQSVETSQLQGDDLKQCLVVTSGESAPPSHAPLVLTHSLVCRIREHDAAFIRPIH